MRKQNRLPVLLAFLALATLSFISIFYYRSSITEMARMQVYRQLSDLSAEQASILDSRLSDQFTLLNSFSRFLATHSTISREQFTKDMDSIVKGSPFSHMAFVDNVGNGYLNTGESISVAQEIYFKTAIGGTESIERVDKPCFSEISQFIQAVPVSDGNGGVKGVLLGSYDEKMLRSLLATGAFSGNSAAFICNSKGDIIVPSDAEHFLYNKGNLLENYSNIIKGYSLVTPLDGETVEELAYNLAHGRGGIFSFALDDIRRNIIYSPLEINDWFLLTSTQGETVSALIFESSRPAFIMLAIILVCSVVALIFVIWLGKHNESILDAEQEKLRISEEEYRIAIMQTNKKIARYDIATATLYQHHSKGGTTEFKNVPASVV